jgi:flagellin-like hook-associated protein FlgL
MRVTFNSFPDTLLGRLQSLGKEQNKSLTQLSTGQRLAAPSDDAPAMQRILNLRTEKKQNQQFHRNATDGLEKSKVTFSSLEQIKDLVVRASELSANINGATSEQEYKAKASEINQLIEQGLNVANTKLRGNYLFSGDSNSKIPFEEKRSLDGKITSVSYNGSSSESKIHIGEGESASITVGSMADENRAVADTLSKLIELRNAMSAAPSATKTQSILDLRAKVPVKLPATTIVGTTINLPSGFDVGHEVTFTLTSGKGAPLENGKPYFVVDLGSGKKGISATDGGAAITLTQEIDAASKVSKKSPSVVGPTPLHLSKTGSTINLPTNILLGDTITFDFTAGKGAPLQSGQRYYVVDLDSGNKGVSMTPGGPAISLTQEIDTASTVSKVRLDTVEDTILSALSRAGTIQYRLETAMKDLEVRYEGTEKLISTDADIDFAEATVRLNRAQMAYQAAIQSGARIQSNSLLDYLR